MSDLNEIVAAHSDAVWRTVYRLLNDRDDALDCYQETFLAAQQLATSGRVQHWRTLLVRIATRRAIDRLRQRYRGEETQHSAQDRLPERTATTSPDARVEADELREQVRRALANLPEQQAEAFWLRHLEQMSAEAIAEQMGIERGHVRVLVHRAAVGLRATLGPTYGPVPEPEEERT